MIYVGLFIDLSAKYSVFCSCCYFVIFHHSMFDLDH